MLEVFEIYQPPQADRNKIAGKMLGHILTLWWWKRCRRSSMRAINQQFSRLMMP